MYSPTRSQRTDDAQPLRAADARKRARLTHTLERMARWVPLVRAAAIGTLVFVVIFALGTEWMRYACLPSDGHTFKWQCEVGLWFPSLAAVLGGATSGFLFRRKGFLLGISIPILGLLVLAATPFLHGWYGADLPAAAERVVILCLVPAAVAGQLGKLVSVRRTHAL